MQMFHHGLENNRKANDFVDKKGRGDQYFTGALGL